MPITLDGTNGVTTNSGTLISATTIGVGNATPSTSGAGITFPATQSASTDANTLDDYEEGTFTPTLEFSGGTTGITYASGRRAGRYTKIGRMVYFTIFVELTNKGSSSGNAEITGLPFTAASTDTYVPMSFWLANMSSLTGNLMPRITDASSSIVVWQQSSSSFANTTNSNFTNTSTLQLSGQYEV